MKNGILCLMLACPSPASIALEDVFVSQNMTSHLKECFLGHSVDTQCGSLHPGLSGSPGTSGGFQSQEPGIH